MAGKKAANASRASSANGTPNRKPQTPAATPRTNGTSGATETTATTATANGRLPTVPSSTPAGPPPPASRPHSPRSLLFPLFAFFAILSYVAIHFHYKLPSPVTLSQNLASETAGQGAIFSEEGALQLIKKLSEDIGYRIVGTEHHVAAEDWLLAELKKYEGTHNLGGEAGKVQVEVWRQIGDGAHRFDFISSTVWKKYYSMSNLIVRISDGTEQSKANSVLLNSHLDSTLPSPGAADDGVGVAIMTEVLRILTTPGAHRKRLRNSVVLLFNNGEESFQDASHLFITSNHTTVPSIRSVINLEACGVSGPELLFQAASNEMIKAYGKAPYPFGTVLANDVFSSGIVLSDTDYRQFVEYGKLIGLDMAIVGNSYLYHTRKDLPDYIQPGAIQHFGENVLTIVDYLTTSEENQLAKVAPTPRSEAPVYFTLLGKFFINIPAKTFKGLSMGLSAFTNFQIQSSVKAERHFAALKATTLCIVGTIGGLLAAIAASNAVALVMTRGLDRSLSWFSHEWLPVPLYAPPAIAAMLSIQLAISKAFKKEERPYLERASLNGLLIFFVLILVCMNAFSIGSAYLFGLGAVTILLAICVNDFAIIGWGNIELKQVPVNRRVHWSLYFIMAFVPAIVGTEGLTSFLDLFTPLVGRTGEVSPADHLLASIVSFLSFLCFPFLFPLSHRFGTKFLGRAIIFFLSLTIAAIAIYASPAMKPFDALHPKRLFTHQVHNLTSGEWYMNLGSADPAPSKIIQSLADGLQAEFGLPGEKASLQQMTKYNPDFDILYPVSSFITPWKFRLPRPDYEAGSDKSLTRWTSDATPGQNFIIRSHSEVIDLDARTRKLTLEIYHPSIIWSVLAFDAEVLEWDLPSQPPKGYRRHHIKEVSRYGSDTWSIDLLLRIQESEVHEYVARQQLSQQSAESSTGNTVWDKVKSGLTSTSSDATSFSHLISLPPNSPPPSTIQSYYDSSAQFKSRLLIDYSGLWGEAMYPSALQSKNKEVLHSEGVKRFAQMDRWLASNWPEIDAMLLNVVAGVAIA
ncbi:unnamed protein product [Sympodiomycopsis kandeliae]